jgi:hypothetical protein
MSEGSSLSARESLTALGRAEFEVDVIDANPLCLARFSSSAAEYTVSRISVSTQLDTLHTSFRARNSCCRSCQFGGNHGRE